MTSLASLSLDLDNEWAYLRSHGDPQWASHPSYLAVAVPRVLALLARRRLHVTFFVVGLDAAAECNREALGSIAAAGHEIANHSERHEPWLHLYSREELIRELAEAEEHIEKATGRHPRGFRGPGYSLSAATLQLLAERGYRYDASTLPTFLGPVARLYHRAITRTDPAEREKRAALFGSWRDGMRPLRPYRWRLGERTLLEIPITTFPGLRLPIHLTYVNYLASFAPRVAEAWFAAALRSCRLAGIEPSILLHPLDVLGGDDVPRMRFFPGMQQSAGAKIERLERCLDRLQASFEVCSVGDHAERAALRDDLRIVERRVA
jgi:peptidoglycan/xylan/chitin deacetylase (PgdA/CDA1 family)